ncbi:MULTISPECIES: hypothetical protein [Bacillaceae]|uniref:Uncharacterized protein n=1 Tax=Domibacillus aminovorans TaxID=29332 RepID=A0A177KXB9_9BACI|nr:MULTISPECIES: hypothetical protein [Bacillaceae]OAH57973.1 hypothetical protein AWH48_02915 [Domibacillus aminovorans]
MLPIEIFGWIISMILGVVFIGSLVALPKGMTSKTETEKSFTQQTISEKKIKDRPTKKIS